MNKSKQYSWVSCSYFGVEKLQFDSIYCFCSLNMFLKVGESSSGSVLFTNPFNEPVQVRLWSLFKYNFFKTWRAVFAEFNPLLYFRLPTLADFLGFSLIFETQVAVELSRLQTPLRNENQGTSASMLDECEGFRLLTAQVLNRVSSGKTGCNNLNKGYKILIDLDL